MRLKVKIYVLSLKCPIGNRRITILYKSEQQIEEANFNLCGGYGVIVYSKKRGGGGNFLYEGQRSLTLH